jgi:arabinofuranosyltransferase
VVLFVAPAVILVIMAWQHRWIGDDAFIDFRIVKQIRAGNGPVFNLGERVEAGTSPLWLAILFVVHTLVPLRLEWTAVVLGIGFTATGVLLAERGAWLVVRATNPDVVVVPFGALALIALPPMWDYSTSGLETGLSFGWLGLCFWGIARQYHRSVVSPSTDRLRPPLWLCVVIGLGPLVRPDFAIYSAAFIVAAFVVDPGRRWRDRTRALVAIFALPVACELFRMGYYGILVPNTALAKESGLANWGQGWRYFKNYIGPYWLWFPLLVSAFVAVVTIARAGQRRDIRRLVVLGAPILGALLSAVYVVRVGGDFMHARMLLPATFAALLPVSVLEFRAWYRVAVAALAGWAVICAVSLRAPFPTRTITDERRFWQVNTRVEHPVTVDDFRLINGYKNGELAKSLDASGTRVLAIFGQQIPLAASVKQTAAVQAGSVGVAGYLAPTDVYVIDTLGLADPIGSRLRIGKRGRPGHEKVLPQTWMSARFTDSDKGNNADARRALGCDGLHDVIEATSGSLGIGDFFRNMLWSPRLTSLRFSEVPSEAEKELCGNR